MMQHSSVGLHDRLQYVHRLEGHAMAIRDGPVLASGVCIPNSMYRS
jgi:hypothetical protein